MNVYFDASAFTNIVLRDDGWDRIAAWLAADGSACHISDFGWGEFISAVSIRVRRNVVTDVEARETIAAAGRFAKDWRFLRCGAQDVAAAIDLVERFDLGLRMPDALHIALARRSGIPLLTTDSRQSRACQAIDHPTINPFEGSRAS
ncbi:type II toxin-antitoxin system VapC family toxin [Sphingomonas sp. RP10(2022)]|uniref:Ribonuclease VapC n=1 Tax=Sphingomonas liriopis TaxID=2949094 RepID=A0A9X2I0P5_9SPHN|nr:type II toxin-antitoxin system VapC family toxin [Sphingomonas liriopis]MCP3736340.1 type II toxin-antitoxin system VapC family toxin [Sphingomonas liriopis]